MSLEDAAVSQYRILLKYIYIYNDTVDPVDNSLDV